MTKGGEGLHNGGCGCPSCMATGSNSGLENMVPTHKLGVVESFSPQSLGGTSSITAGFINALDSGVKWSGAGTVNVTYTFKTLYLNQANPGATSFQYTNAEQQAGVLAVFKQFSNIANIKFTESTNPTTANIKIAMADLPSNTAGWAYFPNSRGSDLIIDVAYKTGFTPGNFGYFLVMHELGHAVGLSHPNNNGTDISYNNNGTMMSYNAGSIANPYNAFSPQTPMIYDIAALQSIYGANTSFNSGSTNYIFSTAAKVQTIWDGGGTDTFDFSSVGTAATIDLREGIDNVSRTGNSSTWIAFGANIENASGTSFSDTINGNKLNNSLSAGSGNDTVFGNDGNDTISGQNGSDSISGGTGNDIIDGGAGADTIRGGNDADSIYGGGSGDFIYGDAGNDTLTGGTNDSNDGTDVIYGGDGSDKIFGAGGTDYLFGEGGADSIHGGTGSDYLIGGVGNDSLYGGDGADTLNGGGGNDIFQIHTLNNSTITSRDIIQSFTSGQDKIDLTPLPFTAIASGAANGSTLGFSFSGNNTIVSAASSNFSFLLEGKLNLTNSDFLF